MTTPPHVFTTDDGSLADLPRIISFFHVAAMHVGVQQGSLFDVELALDEACTNVFEHAYPEHHGALRLQVEAEGGDLVLTLEDWGRPFDPDCVATPDTAAPLCDRPIGGLGLYLIRQLMDDVRFTFDQSSNLLVMTKRDVIPQDATSLVGGDASPDNDDACYS